MRNISLISRIIRIFIVQNKTKMCRMGSHQFAHSRNPYLPEGEIVFVINVIMTISFLPPVMKNGGKKMEKIPTNNVMPMGPFCSWCDCVCSNCYCNPEALNATSKALSLRDNGNIRLVGPYY